MLLQPMVEIAPLDRQRLKAARSQGQQGGLECGCSLTSRTGSTRSARQTTNSSVWDSFIAQITGRWVMRCDKWIWNIDISADASNKWSDYYNPSMNGSGTWHLTEKGMYVMWKSGSRDDWTITEMAAMGTARMAAGTFPFSASKVS
jgi:hypothetical protein